MKSFMIGVVYFTQSDLPSLLKEMAYYIESNKFQGWIHSCVIGNVGEDWSGTLYEYQTKNEIEQYLERTPE